MIRYLLILGVICFSVLSCAKPEQSLVGLSLPTQREERWVRDKEAMISEAAKLGLKLEIAVSDNDAALQIAQCEELIDLGIKALILAPHDARSAATIVEMAHRKEIPVISYDRLILNAPVDLYITFDNWEVGRIQARYLVSQVPRGNYIVLSGSPTDNNSSMFLQGAMEILQPLSDSGQVDILLTSSIADWKPAEAHRIIMDAFELYPDIDAILAPNDGTASGVIRALERLGQAGLIPVTGQDSEIGAAKLIVKGLQSMTVFKDTRALAARAIEISKKIAEEDFAAAGDIKIFNGTSHVPSILLKPVLVTKDNLDKILIESGYIRKEDVYGQKE